MLRRLLLEVYGQILFLPMIVREKSRSNHLVRQKRSTLLVASIKGLLIPHTIGLLQSEPTYLIHIISISRFIFSSLTLIGLVCNHDHHIRDLLLINHLNYMFIGLWDSIHHWAWPQFELLRSFEISTWLFPWHHVICCILFLLISICISIVHIIKPRDMILSIALHSTMWHRTWFILVSLTCLAQVWLLIPLSTHSTHAIPFHLGFQ